ncbi:MAG: ABC transporter permease [Oscillospiraceae bacterium]|jgi:ABC-type uncharacterized transport system permease subunit|nr:ABC transporter permease [Oscillospiraceae bacterium]
MNKKKEKLPYLSAIEVEKQFSIIRTAMAAGIAILFCFVLIILSSKNPSQDIITFLTAPVSSFNRFCTFLIKLSPLLFTSCATCILFSADTPNCSVETAFFMGAISATAIGTIQGIPPVIHFLLMALAGMVGASIVLLIPSLLNFTFNANILVCSLMLNYIMNLLGNYLVTGPMKDPSAGWEASAKIATSAKLPKFINMGPSQVHCGLLIGLAVVVLAWFLLYKSKFGYESRTVGANRSFARFSGINIGKVVVMGSVVAGAMTGLGSACEISGYFDRLQWNTSPGYGWDAIMIATLAHNNPKFVVPAAMFVAYIRTSADMLNITSVVPIEVVEIAQQVVIVMIAAKGLLSGLEKKSVVKNAKKQMAYVKEEG